MLRKTLIPILVITLLGSTLVPKHSAAAKIIPSPDTSPSVYVQAHHGEQRLTQNNLSLLMNDLFQLSVNELHSGEFVDFYSNDPSVVSVDQASNNSCTGKALNAGTTQIIAKIKVRTVFFFSKTIRTLKCKVTVSPSAVSIRFKSGKVTLKAGAFKQLPIILKPTITTEQPIFKSSNKNIAVVDSNGIVRGISHGKAIVTASIQNGQTTKCKVTVK